MKNKAINTILIMFVSTMLVTLAFFVRQAASADKVAVLQAAGITCGGCGANIEKALQAKGGVTSVDVDVDTGLVTVAYDSRAAKPEALAETVSALGYGSRILTVMTVEEYTAKTGKSVASLTPAGTGGCGGCCNRNRN